MFEIQVFSSKLTTKKNPSGCGTIDLDTPEGVAVFGGQKAVGNYRYEQLIQDKMLEILRVEDIKKLKKTDVLPANFKEV